MQSTCVKVELVHKILFCITFSSFRRRVGSSFHTLPPSTYSYTNVNETSTRAELVIRSHTLYKHTHTRIVRVNVRFAMYKCGIIAANKSGHERFDTNSIYSYVYFIIIIIVWFTKIKS